MTAKEIMKKLYPDLPEWQLNANTEWLEEKAQWIIDGGLIISPAGGWGVRKIKLHEYEIAFVLKPEDL